MGVKLYDLIMNIKTNIIIDIIKYNMLVCYQVTVPTSVCSQRFRSYFSYILCNQTIIIVIRTKRVVVKVLKIYNALQRLKKFAPPLAV